MTQFTKRSLLRFALIALITAASQASTHAVTTYSDYFREGISARSMGMGETFMSVADDVDAAYWNPAGLVQMDKGAFSLTKSSYKSNLGFNTYSFGYAYPMGESTVAASAVRTDYYGIQRTGVLFSYSRYVAENLSVGVNAKSLRLKYGNNNPSTWGFDIGAMYQLKPGIRAGAMLANIGDVAIGKENVPFSLRVGVSAEVPAVPNLLFAASYESSKSGDGTSSLGAEYRVGRNMFLRAGSTGSQFEAGIGVAARDITLDYAFYSSSQNVDANKVSVGYRVGPPRGLASKRSSPKQKQPEKKPATQAFKQTNTEVAKSGSSAGSDSSNTTHRNPRKVETEKAPEQKAEPKRQEKPATNLSDAAKKKPDAGIKQLKGNKKIAAAEAKKPTPPSAKPAAKPPASQTRKPEPKPTPKKTPRKAQELTVQVQLKPYDEVFGNPQPEQLDILQQAPTPEQDPEEGSFIISQ